MCRRDMPCKHRRGVEG